MSNLQQIAHDLVTLCRAGKNRECMEKYYSDDIVSVEAIDVPGGVRETKGKADVFAKSKWWEENHEVHSAVVDGPYPHGDDRFAVLFNYDITRKPTQERVRMREIAVYQIAGDKIVREEFFYGP